MPLIITHCKTQAEGTPLLSKTPPKGQSLLLSHSVSQDS